MVLAISKRSFAFVFVIATLFAAGCKDSGQKGSSDSSVLADGGGDGSVVGDGGSSDAVATDGARDAQLDATPDANVDGSVDAATDGSVDGARDASGDGAIVDGAIDAAVDATLDGAFQASLTSASVRSNSSAGQVDTAMAFSPASGRWRAEVTLPAGPANIVFRTASQAGARVIAGTVSSPIPAQKGQGATQLGNQTLAFEIPIPGVWQIELVDQSSEWSIRPGAALGAGGGAGTAAFVAMLTDIADLNPTLAAARVDTFVQAIRTAKLSTPFINGDSALFVSLTAPSAGGPPFVAGTFNAWSDSAWQLVSLHGRAAYLARPVAAQRHEYKFVSNSNWARDPQASDIVWDGIPRAGYGDFNSAFTGPNFNYTGPRIFAFNITPQNFSATRGVYVYLPAGYDAEPTRRYPLLILHDGNETITRSHFDEVATTTFAANRAEKTILAFVDLPSPGARTGEYTFGSNTFGDEYGDFLASELIPVLDQKFRTRANRTERALLGQSLGGLISYYVAFHHHAVFGKVGGMSSSFFWENNGMITLYQNSPVLPLSRLYLDSGSPNDNMVVTQQMADVLTQKGYQIRHTIAAGAQHDWGYWEQRFDEALEYLFPAP